MWMMPLHLHVNQKSDYDYDELPAKKAKTNRADPDQTASEEVVLSGSSLFAIMTSLFVNCSPENQYFI